MISQLKQFGGNGAKNAGTSVLNRDVNGISSNQPLGANHTFQSMFSLRSNRTMKLQRYGPWIGNLNSFEMIACLLNCFC